MKSPAEMNIRAPSRQPSPPKKRGGEHMVRVHIVAVLPVALANLCSSRPLPSSGAATHGAVNLKMDAGSLMHFVCTLTGFSSA